jgi:hypothetical protein
MPMIRITLGLGLALLWGCASSAPNPGMEGPTGRLRDTGNIVSLRVRDTWKEGLKHDSQALVVKQLQFGSTARFDPHVDYEAYYDRINDLTRVAVYGNVTSSSTYGTTDNNGYYVTWELPGRIETDFPPLWQLADVEVLDQQY